MTTTTAIVAVCWAWWVTRWARREFRRGYLLAVGHVEQMTRPGKLSSYGVDEAIAKLREEMPS